jgi:hypothetical protein
MISIPRLLRLHWTLIVVVLVSLACEEESTSVVAPNVLVGTWNSIEDPSVPSLTVTFATELTGTYAMANADAVYFSYVFTATTVTLSGTGITGTYRYELVDDQLHMFDRVLIKQ